MAKAARIPVVAAGWGHAVQPIESYMRSECLRYFETVEDFKQFLLEDAWS